MAQPKLNDPIMLMIWEPDIPHVTIEKNEYKPNPKRNIEAKIIPAIINKATTLLIYTLPFFDCMIYKILIDIWRWIIYQDFLFK